MPIREAAWPEGTPCWVDCQLDDPAKGSEFYTELFGWDIIDGGDAAGGYRMASIAGQPAAGLMSKPPGMVMPSVWTTYFAADNADAVQTKIIEAGGKVTMPAMDVMDVGRMLIAEDPTGAVFGVWESRSHTGANIFNENGAYVWNDLHTKEYASAQEFYSQVFDWNYTEIGDGVSMTYSVFAPSGAVDSVGGISLDTPRPEGLPNYWLAWFQSDDVDAITAKVVKLGGSVLMQPEDSPFGHMAIVTGPQGEMFGVINTKRKVGQ